MLCTRRLALAVGAMAMGSASAYGELGDLLHAFVGDAAGVGLGHAVASAGDVDGDGFDDLIVGYRQGTGPGHARVYSGASGALLHHFTGMANGDRFGRAVGGAGDVDGDGHADLIVGAAGEDTNGLDSGAVYVFSGRDGSLLFKYVGASERTRLGSSVSGVGDLDGDGAPDIVVGAQPDSVALEPRGHAIALSGATGEVLYMWVGTALSSRLGCSVAAAGDVDGDGRPDVLIGDWRDGPLASAGSASVFSGANGSLLLRVHGTAGNQRLGSVVAGVGDMDGDGRADFLAGSPWAHGHMNAVGLVRVYSGANGAVLHSLQGDTTNDFFGMTAAGLGDFDGDGVPDFAVGAYGDDDAGVNSGSARVYSGADGSLVLRIDGNSAADELGYSVSSAGRAADGTPLLAIGAPNDNVGFGSGSGAVYVYTGVTPPPPPPPPPGPPAPESYCTPGPNLYGPGATMGHLGSTSVSECDFTLTVQGARPRSAGFFFFGGERANEAYMKGRLCIAPPRQRVGLPVLLDRDGVARLELVRARRPWVRELVVPGATWQFQFIYLDPPSRRDGVFNLSDGLSVTFAP